MFLAQKGDRGRVHTVGGGSSLAGCFPADTCKCHRCFSSGVQLPACWQKSSPSLPLFIPLLRDSSVIYQRLGMGPQLDWRLHRSSRKLGLSKLNVTLDWWLVVDFPCLSTRWEPHLCSGLASLCSEFYKRRLPTAFCIFPCYADPGCSLCSTPCPQTRVQMLSLQPSFPSQTSPFRALPCSPCHFTFSSCFMSSDEISLCGPAWLQTLCLGLPSAEITGMCHSQQPCSSSCF